jgi:hypothetical protein
MSDFDDAARAALGLAGMSLDEGDLEVLRMVARVAEPGARALDAADLVELPLEGDLDPGRAPARAATPASR